MPGTRPSFVPGWTDAWERRALPGPSGATPPAPDHPSYPGPGGAEPGYPGTGYQDRGYPESGWAGQDEPAQAPCPGDDGR